MRRDDEAEEPEADDEGPRPDESSGMSLEKLRLVAALSALLFAALIVAQIVWFAERGPTDGHARRDAGAGATEDAGPTEPPPTAR